MAGDTAVGKAADTAVGKAADMAAAGRLGERTVKILAPIAA